MYKTNGNTHHLKVHGESLAAAQALPQNTTLNGTGVKLGGTLGSTEIVIRANTALAVADTKVFSVKLQDSADNSTFANLQTVYSLTAAGGNGAIAADTELARYVIPTTANKWVRAVITTDDAAATGDLDILPINLPR